MAKRLSNTVINPSFELGLTPGKINLFAIRD
jgi:hypothetical protein